MYQLFVETENSFSPDLAGEFSELELAQKEAKKVKAEDPTITYTIEESNGSVNSYGDLLTSVVERG